MPTDVINWGLLGTGRISRTFAQALKLSRKNNLTAAGSRSRAGADAYATDLGLDQARVFDSYEQLLADDQVDAVYIATPHTEHACWVLRALQAGKAVLCEKPMGLNHAECMAMIETAKRHQVFLMEAYMYRLHPQTLAVLAELEAGAIGEVRHVEAQFGYHAPFAEESRLFANSLAGGGIMDVGGYPLSFARLVLGAEPTNISAHGHLGKTGVDEWSAALLSFHNGTSAQIATSVSVGMDNHAVIYGSKGIIRLDNPWLPGNTGKTSNKWQFTISQGQAQKTISGSADPLYVIEADHVADCLAKGLLESDLLPWQNSLDNALCTDKWRAEIGLQYRSETPQHHIGPLWGNVPRRDKISTARVKHLSKDVARLVMGCDNQPSMSHASAMWDDYVLQGGNCFDTAHIYGQGSMESLLGHWHQRRGIRDDLVIIGKGAHTPHNFPDYIGPQLDISLDRLQTDYVDIYFLHRDNPEVPVEDFVDALNREVAGGRIRAFGGSNWSLQRIQAANNYARTKGLQGFSAVSNNFSLARMVEPIWPGVETVNNPAYQAYLRESQLALMPWSAQARGFFTPWADQVLGEHARENPALTTMQPTIKELKRVWFSADNLERRSRAGELAEKYGVEMINIALAYVLCQPYPTFALIGPRVMAETASCISALGIALDKNDIAFLEGREV